jgi:DNA ligase-1
MQQSPSRHLLKPALCIAALLSCLAFPVYASDVPLSKAVAPAPVMLANVYRPGIALDDYWISEKYDGVRGYWDGSRLYTRKGELIHVPAWFVEGWPQQALDGELWGGRGRFEQTVATVRKRLASDAAWRELRFMVFDLPVHVGVFNQRLPALQSLLATSKSPWLQLVAQRKVSTHTALQTLMEHTVAQGGEGLMLHRGDSYYRAERTDDLLKFKPYEDSEAVVIGHIPGKGKYAGLLGALLVQLPNGLQFKLGSGLSDAQRQHPPAIGSSVTYRYSGFHSSGIPRFAVFMRVRND